MLGMLVTHVTSVCGWDSCVLVVRQLFENADISCVCAAAIVNASEGT